MELQHPHPATLVTEDHQILSQNADPHRHVLQRIRPYHGMPEPAQIFAARCARPDVGEFLVFRRYLIVQIPTVRGSQKGRSGRHYASPSTLVPIALPDTISARPDSG